MKYMLLIDIDEQALRETERDESDAESVQLMLQLNSRGQYLVANPLHPMLTAISVRVRDGKALVTDGPFAETREWLGGVTAPIERTLRAKNRARATEPTTHTCTLDNVNRKETKR
jgi:hypothetical protein